MTFEYADKGAPAVSTTSDRDPSTALDAFVRRLRDSSTGLRTAADLVDGDSLTRFLAGLIERRRAALDSLVAVVADVRRQSTTDSSGTVTEAARRGWMRLVDSIGGDDATVVNTAIDGEKDLLDEANELLAIGLPRAIADELRSLAGEIGADIARLSKWQHTLSEDDSR